MYGKTGGSQPHSPLEKAKTMKLGKQQLFKQGKVLFEREGDFKYLKKVRKQWVITLFRLSRSLILIADLKAKVHLLSMQLQRNKSTKVK